ncbi:MAG: AI-2E family transporter [Marmoricola sp.]
MTPGDLTAPVVLPRWLIVLMGTAAATITIAGLMGASDLIGPVFLALVLTIAAHPLRGWLQRRHLPGWLATLVMALTVYTFLLVFGLALVLAAAEFAALLPTYKDQMSTAVQDATSWLTNLGVNETEIDKIAGSFDVGRLTDLVGEFLGGLLGLLGDLFFIVTLLLFLAVDAAWFPRRLGETAERAPLVTALSSFASGTRSYLVVSTVFGLIVAVIDTGLLWVMGIPAPLLWGLLAFITNYIPNIGFIIGLIPVAVLGFLEGGLGLMLGVIAVYSLVNVVIQSVIQPKVVGDAVGLSATLSFLSLVFWAWVLGAVGALLAIPLSLLVKSLFVDIDPSTSWLRPLIGDPAKPASEAPDQAAP